MGRSVSSPSGAIVAYRILEREDDDDWDFAYQDLIDSIIDDTKAAFPSFNEFDGWRGREDRILLRNAFADVGVSIYCSLVAVWLVERDDAIYWERNVGISRTSRAQHWLAQVESRFIGLFGQLRCVGRFSNGEAIFERSNAGE